MIQSNVEGVREDAAEKARGDSDQRGCEQADVVSAWEDEPPERPDHQAGERKPEQREGQADERACQQQGKDDDQQDDDDRHGADANEFGMKRVRPSDLRPRPWRPFRR